jgi:pimeloyl-ACP methyl ester carboxylesterase
MSSEPLHPRPLTVNAGGLPLRVWDHGGPGVPVLFLHGHLDTGRSFDDVAALVRTEYRCLCLDARGHGQSAWAPPGASYHALDHLKDLVHVLDELDALGLATQALIGHSLGGSLALLLAGTLVDRVPRYLVLDGFGMLSEAPEAQPARLAAVLESIRHEKKPFGVFSSVEAAVDRIQANNPGLSRDGAAHMVRHALHKVAEDRYEFRFDRRLRGPTPVRYPEAMWLALCSRVRSVVRVLRAEHGYVPLVPEIERRLASIAGATMRTVAGVSHHLHLDAPAEVAAELRLLFQPVPDRSVPEAGRGPGSG